MSKISLFLSGCCLTAVFSLCSVTIQQDRQTGSGSGHLYLRTKESLGRMVNTAPQRRSIGAESGL